MRPTHHRLPGPGSVAEPTAKIYGMMQFGFKMIESTYTCLTTLPPIDSNSSFRHLHKKSAYFHLDSHNHGARTQVCWSEIRGDILASNSPHVGAV